MLRCRHDASFKFRMIRIIYHKKFAEDIINNYLNNDLKQKSKLSQARKFSGQAGIQVFFKPCFYVCIQ